MLPKKNRADKKTVDKIFMEGKSVFSPSLTFKFILTNKAIPPQVSFISPKNIARLAVKRNMLRRRGYDALKKYINNFPAGLAGVLIFKKYEDDVSILEHEIENLLAKLN
jgi:ribonuclease P protein component